MRPSEPVQNRVVTWLWTASAGGSSTTHRRSERDPEPAGSDHGAVRFAPKVNC